MTHTITIDEGQRQAILLAIAHLGIARPGLDMILSELALLMDNKLPDGQPQMFRELQAIEMRARAPIAYTAGGCKGLAITNRFAFDESERQLLTNAAQFLAEFAGVTVE